MLLDEADRLFVCQYCRVKSCICQKGFGRYYLSPHKAISQEITFLPYWRFKGVEYTCTPTGVDHRFMDISWLALKNPLGQIPFSLGFRSQALTLKRVSAKTPGTFIKPLGFNESFPHERGKKHRIPDQFTEDIGETSSLIFAPFYEEDNTLFDGILNTPISSGEPFLSSALNRCRPEKETLILSGLCPGCGWDLEGQSDSLALVCRNCHNLWQPRKDKLAPIRYGAAPVQTRNQVLIPFWKIHARIQGLDLGSLADLLALANLHPKARDKGAEHIFHFWAPAFKIRPKIFLRISRQLTLGQPAPELKRQIEKNTCLPVTLPAGEAVQSIRVLINSLARPLKDHYHRIAAAEVTPSSATLVFLPFDTRYHDYFHPGLNLAINQNVLNLSGNL